MRPIILVPGFRDDTRILRRLKRHLTGRGATVHCISPQPSSGHAEIQVLAQKLAGSIQACSGTNPIDLFGFSMGGLICRYYLQRLDGAKQVRRLVTVATPHYGSWSSYVMLDRPACVQMRPGSPFLQDLNADLSPLEPLAPLSVWTPFDLSILPPTSSCLPVGRSRRILSPFHGTLMIDPRVLRLVGDAFMLQKAEEALGEEPEEEAGVGERTSNLQI